MTTMLFRLRYFRFVLLFALLAAGTQVAQAQAAIFALLFGDKVASEQFHLSMDLGVNISSLPGLPQQKTAVGFYFGLGTYIKLNEKWALTPEFKPVSPRGARQVLPMTDYAGTVSNPEYRFLLNYIDVPILAQYKVSPKFFVSAGPQISFRTSAKQATQGKLAQGNEVDIEESMKQNFESVYFALPLEVGYTLSPIFKGKPMDLKIRYNIGLSEMIAHTSYGSSKGSAFQIFLSFPFVKQPAATAADKP